MEQRDGRRTRHRALQALRQQRLQLACPPSPNGTGHARHIGQLDRRIQVDLERTISHAGVHFVAAPCCRF
jgi:hypothetical protein